MSISPSIRLRRTDFAHVTSRTNHCAQPFARVCRHDPRELSHRHSHSISLTYKHCNLLRPLTHTRMHSNTHTGIHTRRQALSEPPKTQEGSERSNVCSYFATNIARERTREKERERNQESDCALSATCVRSLSLWLLSLLPDFFFNSLTQFECRSL